MTRCFLAELYDPDARHDPRLIRTASNDASARCIRVINVPGDEACFLVYEAQSAEAVWLAGTAAGLRFTRVVPAEIVV